MSDREREIQDILNSLPTQSINAVNRLRQIGRLAIPALGVALRYPDTRVRTAAARALGRLNDASGVPALGGALEDAESGVRLAAILALADIPSPVAVQGLAEALRARHALVRDCAARALARRSLIALRGALCDPDPVVRAAAAHGVGYYAQDRESVERLRDLLHDSNADVRLMAVRALAWISVSHRDVLPYLFEALRHPDDDVRATAAHYLGRVGDPTGSPALVALLQDPCRHVVLEAVRSLGTIEADVRGGRAGIGDRRAIPALLELVGSSDTEVRLAATSAVAFVLAANPTGPRDPQTVPRLVERLTDDDPHVRAVAATALADTACVEVIPPLIDALQDPVWSVRASAASALGAIGDQEAIPILESLREDPDLAVSSRAERALQHLRSRLF